MKVGIDLGTSNILVYRINRGAYEPIHIDGAGNNMMPSVLRYTNGRIIVGTEAKNARLLYPEHCISGSKVYIGKNKTWNIDGEIFTPERVAEEFLRKIYSCLEMKKTSPDEKIIATITVPACFSQRQVELTEIAARNVGIEVKNIVQEPIAAAKAARIDNNSGMLFVVDIGGGTLDISVIENALTDAGPVTRVVAIGGSAELGGNDFDEAVYRNILMPAVERSNGENYEQRMTAMQCALANVRLRSMAEEMKCHFQESTDMFIDEIFTEFPETVNISVTWEQYKAAVADCVTRAKKSIYDVVDDMHIRYNVSPADMKAIIVGGMAKERLIREYISEVFGKGRVIEVLRPLTAVAEGAARFAAERSNNVPAMLSSDIGIMVSTGHEKEFNPVLAKNTILNEPVMEQLDVGNACENADKMRIEIYERNGSRLTHYKDIIIPTDMMPIGGNKVRLEFCLDTNRILKVSANYINHDIHVTENIAVCQ